MSKSHIAFDCCINKITFKHWTENKILEVFVAGIYVTCHRHQPVDLRPGHAGCRSGHSETWSVAVDLQRLCLAANRPPTFNCRMYRAGTTAFLVQTGDLPCHTERDPEAFAPLVALLVTCRKDDVDDDDLKRIDYSFCIG